MLYFNTLSKQISPEANVLDQYIIGIADGDKEALGKLYESTCSSIYGFALSIVKNVSDAEDILQDVYIKVFSVANTYQPQGKPMAWLLTITRNLALMRLRGQQKEILLAPEDLLYANNPSVTDEDRMVLQAILAKLKDEERQIVVLHSLTGLKHREIAILLKLPLPTVLSKYNRALKKLRNILKEDEKYDG